MNEQVVPVLGFPRSALLARTGAAGKLTYWRHLLSDEQNMYVMEVNPGVAPKNSRPIVCWKMRTVIGLFGSVIREVEEIVCPKWMQSTELDDEQKSAIALKWNLIAWIVSEGGDSLVTDNAVRAYYIRLAAKDAKVQPPWIRAVLTRYFYYGRHPNALMHLSKFKGAPGVERLGITKAKMGRPNDDVVLNPDTKFTGNNMTRNYLRIWRQVLFDEYALGNKSVSECYEILLLRLRGRNRNIDGEIVSFPIAPEKLPERPLFLRYGTKLIKKFEMKRIKLGHIEWGNKYAGKRGHAESLTHNVIEIYDFDGTEFNIEILYGKRHVGKPLVLFAVDRKSRAIVGWYAWLGREDGYAYKHCLFNAFVSKESWLARYDVSHLTGFVYGVCDQAVFDRGPGISLSVSKALTERIRVDGWITRPRDGKGKGVVENVIGILQNKLSTMDGAYKRTKSVRDQDEHKNAEATATIEYDKFMELLLHAISDHNNFMMADDLLDADMLKAGIGPNPKEIYMFHRGKRRGDASYEWPAAAIYKNLLDRLEVKATSGLVTVDKAKYNSDELTRFYEHHNGGPAKKLLAPAVVIYKFAETNDVLLWEKPDGTLGPLYMMERFQRQYEDSQRWLHHFINRLKNSLKRAQLARKAKDGTLSAAKEKAIREVDGLPQKKAERGTKLAMRKEANSEILCGAFRDNVLLREMNLGGQPAGDADTGPRDVLVGYRKRSRADVSDDMDW